MATESTYILQGTPSSPGQQAFTISKPADGINNSDGQDSKQLILESDDSNRAATSNLHQTGFNYVNSIIGSGVIGIPYALRRAGFGLGLILLIGIAIITDYSLCVLVKAGNLAGVSTYQDVVEAAFGRSGFYLLTVIQFIYPFIAMISYNVIIGDTTTKVLRRMFNVSRESALGNRNSVVLICTIFITLPLSLQRNISKLNKISLASLLFIFFIMIFILFRIGTISPHVPPSADAYSFVSDGITESIGIIAFAYMCHHSSFLLYESLENPTQSRWDKVTHVSVGISSVIVVIFGVAGYVTFTNFSQGDLLENYCLSDDLANVTRVFFTLTIMLTYPIECFVVREVLENAFWGGKPPPTKSHHILVTTAIVFFVFLLSTLTDCLGIVLELNGVLAAVPLAYILPAVTYLKLDPGRLITWQKLPAFLLAIVGFIVAVIGCILAVINVLDGVSCSHGVEMAYCEDAKIYINDTKYLNITNLNNF